MSGTRIVTFPNASLPMADQDPAEVAAAGIHDYVSDFLRAIHDAPTPQRALVISRLIDALMVELGSTQMIALDRADRLC